MELQSKIYLTQTHRLKLIDLLDSQNRQPQIFTSFELFQSIVTCYYALIYRARGPDEEIFVLTFKAYGLNAHLTSLQCACRLNP